MDFGISTISDEILAFIPKLPSAFFSLLLGYLILLLVLEIFVYSLKVFRVPKALATILRSLVNVVLWVILLSQLMRHLGFNQIAITISGSLLVIGLAIANGANTLVADILSGLFLAKDPDFDVGYKVKVGEVEGTIEALDFRKTRIRTAEGKLMVMPNSLVDKDKWQIIEKSEKSSVISKLKSTIIKRRSNEQ